MTPTNGDRRPATTIGELDVHLSYVGEELKEIRQRLQDMATTDDIDALRDELQGYATRKELEALERKVHEQSPSSVMGRAKEYALTFVAFAAAIGAVVAVVNWLKPGSL